MSGSRANRRQPDSPVKPLYLNEHPIQRLQQRGGNDDLTYATAEAILRRAAEDAILDNTIVWCKRTGKENTATFKLTHTCIPDPVHVVLTKGDPEKGPVKWFITTVLTPEKYAVLFGGEGPSLGTLGDAVGKLKLPEPKPEPKPVPVPEPSSPPGKPGRQPGKEYGNVFTPVLVQRGVTIKEVAAGLGFKGPSSLYLRVKQGWTVEEAISIPKGKKREKKVEEVPLPEAKPEPTPVPSPEPSPPPTVPGPLYLLIKDEGGVYSGGPVAEEEVSGKVLQLLAAGHPLDSLHVFRKVEFSLSVKL